MHSSKLLTALVLAMGLMLAACGGGSDSDALVDAFVAEGATAEEAQCFVDAVGPEQAQLIADNIDAEEPPEGVDLDAITTAFIDCGIEL